MSVGAIIWLVILVLVLLLICICCFRSRVDIIVFCDMICRICCLSMVVVWITLHRNDSDQQQLFIVYWRLIRKWIPSFSVNGGATRISLIHICKFVVSWLRLHLIAELLLEGFFGVTCWFIISYLIFSEKEEDFNVDNYIFVHNEPITMDQFRHFSEKQINVIDSIHQ